MAHYRENQRASRRRPKHYAEFFFLLGLRGILRLLPHEGALWMARRLGDVAVEGVRLRRRVALADLRAA